MTARKELLIIVAAFVIGFPLSLMFVKTGIPQAFGAFLMATPWALAAALLALIVGHQLGERRMPRLMRERGENVRRYVLIVATLYMAFGVFFAGARLLTLGKPDGMSWAILLSSLPVYLLFVAGQNWLRYKREGIELPPLG